MGRGSPHGCLETEHSRTVPGLAGLLVGRNPPAGRMFLPRLPIGSAKGQSLLKICSTQRFTVKPRSRGHCDRLVWIESNEMRTSLPREPRVTAFVAALAKR